MRKYMIAVAGAAILGAATSAQAQITTGATSLETVGPPTSGDGGVTTTFGYQDSDLDTPTFTEYLQINNVMAGIYSIGLNTSSANVDFTPFDSTTCVGTLCDGTYLTDLTGSNFYALLFGTSIGSNEFWALPDTALAGGSYLLYINGQNSGTGSLGGSVTITQAIPEPGTWAMMLFGFGAAGFALRRRRRSGGVLAQIA